MDNQFRGHFLVIVMQYVELKVQEKKCKCFHVVSKIFLLLVTQKSVVATLQ